MTRYGSITPTTFKGFSLIEADFSHIAEEMRESEKTKYSLLDRKRDIKLSAQQLETASQNAVNPSQLGQINAGFKAIDATIDGTLDRLSKYEDLVKALRGVSY